ncbi:hypothetical protein P1S88_22660, partial [Escherichia coli]|nr:hypothetical protein [Escherichia coli]
MAKRKNNVVKKIGDSASLLSKPKSILRRKDFKELVTLTKQNSAPGEWKTEIIEHSPSVPCGGNDSNLLIVFYVQIMPDDFVMQLH